jgi:signal transduction histidine kinase
MSGGFKIRLAALILAIGIMVGLAAWAAHSSLRHTGDLSDRLTTVQWQSFQIADHFQQTIAELNAVVLRYGGYHDPSDWQRFEKDGKALDEWIDLQRPMLSTEAERLILDRINAAYDDYLSAARQMRAHADASPGVPVRLVDFADFEKQGHRILKLGFGLAAAHRQSMDSFLADSKKSLRFLRSLQLASLALLLAAGGGLAAMVYRELIAPLKTRLVESQALVERQEKLASLGMLAAGLAHEIRNPLTAMKAWLFIQQKHLRPGTPEEADAQVISGEINRLERIVKDVLIFAKPSEPRLAGVRAREVLEQVRTLLAPEFARKGIELVCEDAAEVPMLVDAEQIRQVLINLVLNGAESIGRDGRVTLRARTGRQRLARGEQETVILEVADTGKGISPEVEKRLFDPFFTTKEEGTGLGLSIAARIIEKHGGMLQYQTQVNRGTIFGIVLPQAPEAAQSA